MSQRKPDRCRTCPGYDWDNGQGFLSFEGPPKNGVVLVGEAGGETEAQTGKCFQGASGKLIAHLFQREGLEREEFGVANVLSCHPTDNKIDTHAAKAALEQCPFLGEALAKWQPRVCVALGNTAFHALVEESINITDARGYPFWSTRYNCWVIPTYHPAFLARGQQRLSRVWLTDVKRAVELARVGMPTHVTHYALDPLPQSAERWADGYFAALSRDPHGTWLAFDIETPMSAKGVDEGELALDDDPTYTILRISFAYGEGEAMTIPWRGDYLGVIARLLGSEGVKLTWNGRYDCPRVQFNGVPVRGPNWDIMLAWHVLNSDLEKGLGFVTPFYVPTQTAWKHLSGATPEVYSATDSDMTWRIAKGVVRDLHAQGMWEVFERHVVRLDVILDAMSKAGVPVDIAARRAFSDELVVALRDFDAKVEAAVPDEARRLKIYKRKPKDELEGLREIPFTVTDKVCSQCGKKATKVHPHVKAGEGTIVERKREATAWAVPQPFKLSTVQLLEYQRVRGHKPILSRDKERRITFDEDAMKALVKRYPKDPLYPLVVDRREVEKLKGTITGEWDEQAGRFVGGMPMDERGYVHTVFCLTGDHEVLTPIGWVRLDQLQEDTAVAQWERGTEALTFVVPSHITRAPYKGLLHHLAGARLALCATPNHRMVYRYRSSRQGHVTCYESVTTLDHLPNRALIPLRGLLGGERLFDVTWRIAVALQADACIESKDGKRGRVRWALTRTRKQQRLRALLTEAGIHWTESIYPHGGQQVVFRVPVAALSHVLCHLGPHKTFDLEGLLQLTPEGKREFLDELLEWDGSRGGGAYRVYQTVNKANAQAVQTIAHVAGQTASCKEHLPYGYGKRPYYNVILTNVDAQTATYRRYTTDYEGPVYCVTVPSEFFITRRNNQICVVGNTHKPSTLRLSSVAPNLQNQPSGREDAGDEEGYQHRVKKLFVAEPGCVLCEIDFSAIEAVLVGYLAGSRDYVRLAKLGVHDALTSVMLYREKKIPQPFDVNWSDADLRVFLKDIKKRFKPTREVAKRIIHGSNYLMTPARMQTLYPEAFPTIRIAGDLQRLYFDAFPDIKRWQTRTVDQAAERAYLRNPFGYRHWFWNVKTWKKVNGQWEVGLGEDAKRAIAFGPQSTAAGIIKEAMLAIWEAGLGRYLRLQVHDSLVCMIPERTLEGVGRAIFRIMTQPIPQLPLDPRWGMGAYLTIGAEAKCGTNWGEMKEVAW